MVDPAWSDLLGTDTGERLRFMGGAVTDPNMSRVLQEAADAWQAGDRSPLLLAVVALAEDMAADAYKEMTHGH